jgi:predicted amidophosphoribosyltransferase
MSVNSMLSWWFSAPGRLWMRWVAGYIPVPESRPLPPDGDRLPTPPGLTLGGPVSGGLALDHYRRHRRLFGRTAVGASMFRFKYRGDLDSGWRLVLAAAAFLRKSGTADRVEIIIAAPSSPVFRDFSPSVWLARKLAKIIDKPVLCGTFKRVRLGLPQKEVASLRAKQANIAGMYAVSENKRELIQGRHVLLVDDISDSGHTLAELHNLLRESGADQVIPFAFAGSGRTGGRV